MATKLIRVNKPKKEESRKEDNKSTNTNKESKSNDTIPLLIGNGLKSATDDKVVLGNYNRDYKTNLLEVGSGNSKKRRNSLEVKKETGLVTAPVNANIELVDKTENNGILITKNYLISKINNLKNEIDSLKKILSSYDDIITNAINSKSTNFSIELDKHTKKIHNEIASAIRYVENEILELRNKQEEFKTKINYEIERLSETVSILNKKLDDILTTRKSSDTYIIELTEPTESVINTDIVIPKNTIYNIDIKIIVSEDIIQNISCKILHSSNGNVYINQQHLGIQLISIAGIDPDSYKLVLSLHSAIFEQEFPIQIHITLLE